MRQRLRHMCMYLSFLSVFGLLSTTFVSVESVQAAPITFGDFVITTGLLAGDTFTIDATTGLFTAWDLNFPESIATTNPAASFTCPIACISQGNDVVSNNFIDTAINQSSQLTFSSNVTPFIYQLNITTSKMNPDFVLANIIYDHTSPNIDRRFTIGQIQPVPEPTSMMLLTTGLLGLASYRWHQRRREGVQTA